MSSQPEINYKVKHLQNCTCTHVRLSAIAVPLPPNTYSLTKNLSPIPSQGGILMNAECGSVDVYSVFTND